MTHIWQTFFDAYAPHYLGEVFTQNTAAEIDFLMAELALKPGQSLLDIGCGVGRHSIPLAKKGLRVTGLDISEGMLNIARQEAAAQGLQVEWIQQDATQFRPQKRYDAVICLCEGAFSLLSTGDDPGQHDMSILKLAYEALEPGGRFLLTALNAMRYIRLYTPADIAAGKFDPHTLVEFGEMSYDTPEGKKTVQVRERGYVPTELALMFRIVGFQVEHLWGGTAGAWNRQPLDPDEYEIMVVARKKA